MSKAFLLAGFNNWGKSSIIGRIFQNNYLYKKGYNKSFYTISGINKKFIVQPCSNDDLGDKYLKTMEDRYNKNCTQLEKHEVNRNKVDLFSALCPSREPKNDSKVILNDQFFQNNFSDIYLFYLEYKWDYHAKLIIDEIKNYYSGLNKIHHIIINADSKHPGIVNDQNRLNLKVSQIINELKVIP